MSDMIEMQQALVWHYLHHAPSRDLFEFAREVRQARWLQGEEFKSRNAPYLQEG